MGQKYADEIGTSQNVHAALAFLSMKEKEINVSDSQPKRDMNVPDIFRYVRRAGYLLRLEDHLVGTVRKTKAYRWRTYQLVSRVRPDRLNRGLCVRALNTWR